MLRWANYPDRVFHELVGDALEFSEAQLGADDPRHDTDRKLRRSVRREALALYRDTLPRSARIFGLHEILPLLRRLGEAHRDETTVYQCTDYHWLVLYESLGLFVEAWGDEAWITAGPYRIKHIDFGALLDHYFWDLDFTLDDIKDAPEFVKAQLGVSPETWGLVVGLKPHPDEIALRPSADWGSGPFRPGDGPRSKRIATYPPERISRHTAWYYG